MLFHVTITHDAAHCPGHHPEMMPKATESLQNMDATAAKFGVTVVGYWSGLPDHVDFLVVDAPGNAPLAAFLSACLPYDEADYDTSAVADRATLLQLTVQMQERQ